MTAAPMECRATPTRPARSVGPSTAETHGTTPLRAVSSRALLAKTRSARARPNATPTRRVMKLARSRAGRHSRRRRPTATTLVRLGAPPSAHRGHSASPIRCARSRPSPSRLPRRRRRTFQATLSSAGRRSSTRPRGALTPAHQGLMSSALTARSVSEARPARRGRLTTAARISRKPRPSVSIHAQLATAMTARRDLAASPSLLARTRGHSTAVRIFSTPTAAASFPAPPACPMSAPTA